MINQNAEKQIKTKNWTAAFFNYDLIFLGIFSRWETFY